MACPAWEQKTGDGEAFREALQTVDRERFRNPTDMGEDVDFGDPEQMRQRDPRLAVLFLEDDEY